MLIIHLKAQHICLQGFRENKRINSLKFKSPRRTQKQVYVTVLSTGAQGDAAIALCVEKQQESSVKTNKTGGKLVITNRKAYC